MGRREEEKKEPENTKIPVIEAKWDQRWPATPWAARLPLERSSQFCAG